jgi:membrane protease YdiL (CAAX protease family)
MNRQPLPRWTADAGAWLPERVASWKFLTASVLVFPLVLLAVASLRPQFLWEPDGWARNFGVHIISIHWPIFALVVLGWLRFVGRIRLRDMGLRARNLMPAIVGTLAAWILAQGVMVAWKVAGGEALARSSLWNDALSAQIEVFSFIANAAATGLNEETFFRGFLFAQVFAAFLARTSAARALIAAILLSSLAFAVVHLQTEPLALAFLFLGGVVSAVLYARTGNLFLSMGLHGLFNAPLAIFATDEIVAKLAVLASVAVIALLWTRFTPRTNR